MRYVEHVVDILECSRDSYRRSRYTYSYSITIVNLPVVTVPHENGIGVTAEIEWVELLFSILFDLY